MRVSVSREQGVHLLRSAVQENPKKNPGTEMNTFDKDLEFGEFWEYMVMSHFNYDSVRKMPGKFSAFDYICVKGNSIVLREIKSDRIASRTGNIVIEFKSRGKASGIDVTHADYWTYCVIGDGDDFDVYDIPVSFLKKAIKEQKFTEIKWGGEDSFLFVFPITFFSSFLLNLNEPYNGSRTG